ncbi:Pre-mRNA-splicing factor SLU7-A [Bienertia sinuspersici]
MDYDGKRDTYNGFDPSSYAYVVHRYEASFEASAKYLKEQQLKKLEEKNKTSEVVVASDDDEDNDDDAFKVDEAKVDESKQWILRRNLCIREDTTKCLLNLDVDSAYYDPKTQSMCEDPLLDADPNEKFSAKHSFHGQALEFKQLNSHAFEAFDKGQDVYMQAAPSQAELFYKKKVNKEKLKSHVT